MSIEAGRKFGDNAWHSYVRVPRRKRPSNVSDIDKKNRISETPLIMAAKKCRVKSMRVLLQWGATPDLVDNLNNTAMHYAAQNNNLQSLTLLMEYNASYRKVNSQGLTPLFILVKKGAYQTLDKFIKAHVDQPYLGCQVNGKTLLHYAVEMEQQECVGVLLKHNGEGERKNFIA